MTNLPLQLSLNLYAGSLKQITDLLAKVPDDRMTQQFPGIVNHPAWTLSHLSAGTGFILSLLDEPIDAATGLHIQAHGPGSIPSPNRADYLSQSQLLEGLTERHARAHAAILAKHEAYFPREAPASIRSFAPTVGTAVMYLVAAHEPYHQGQLSMWMKSAGL